MLTVKENQDWAWYVLKTKTFLHYFPLKISLSSFFFARFIKLTPHNEISPHYRSVGRRQGSCAVLGDVWHYPRISQKQMRFYISITKHNAS